MQKIWVHESIGLERWSQLRLESLRTGQIHHGFHYQSLQQSKLWLEVFRKHSPAAISSSVTTIYAQLAEQVAAEYAAQKVHVVSLGCGDGSKDLLLLQALVRSGAQVSWTPQDISLSLVLQTVQSASALPLSAVHPVVADLQAMPRLAEMLAEIDLRPSPSQLKLGHSVFDSDHQDCARLYTYYGLVPNFHPDFLLQQWTELLRPQDRLLVSANLSPCPDESANHYLTATELIQRQYDNPETKKWLTTILKDWGLQDRLENYRVRLESRHDLLRLVAAMDWSTTGTMEWENELLFFRKGDNLRLFFSYRYTPGRFRQLAARANLATLIEIVAESKEEGVWSCSVKS